jgi:HEAT repeat protein
MPKPSSVEARLDRLAALRSDPSSPEFRDELVKALDSKVNLLAAKAAALAGEFERRDLALQIVTAFGRFMADAAKSDKGCQALKAIATALFDLGAPPESREVFLSGIRHVQKEGSFGPPVDVAAELRGICALGLVKIGYGDAMVELTDLLADAEPQARVGAARALGFTGQDAAALLLRFKLTTGDRDADVMAECMSGLVRLWPRKSVEFVGRFLDSPLPAIPAGAALALGESRQPEALDLLRRHWDRGVDPADRQTVLVAVAMLRLPQSLEFLLSLVRTGAAQDAAEAIEALGIYRHDPAVREQVEAAVRDRTEPGPQRAFRSAFPE